VSNIWALSGTSSIEGFGRRSEPRRSSTATHLVQGNINTMTYHRLVFPGSGGYLGLNREANDVQNQSIRHHTDSAGTQHPGVQGPPVYVTASGRGARQDRAARCPGDREQGDRRASRHATSDCEQVAKALLSRTARGTR